MNKPIFLKALSVSLDFGEGPINLGKLAIRDHQIYFEYDPSFLARNLELSPLRMPVKSGLYQFDKQVFEGLPGLFYDCLPDGWGRLLFDRYVRQLGFMPAQVTPIDRLAYQGSHGLGALTFEPDHSEEFGQGVISLDHLALQVKEVLHDKADHVIQELLRLNGSSAGARPKALVGLNDNRSHILCGVNDLSENYTAWMVKFPNSHDGSDAGAIEYVYALMAKQAGVIMPEVHLFPSPNSAGYFAIQRFDRVGKQRYHMHTACGLLHSDFRTPSLDYEDLIILTARLTRDVREIEKIYRLAVFNVLAHNRDDHSKNFSYLMDSQGRWQLSPAYDLTFSSGPAGQQSTMVMGEGRKPQRANLISLAKEAGINHDLAASVIEATRDSLSQWPKLAKHYGVSAEMIKLIQSKLFE